jgi:hypothetical protein
MKPLQTAAGWGIVLILIMVLAAAGCQNKAVTESIPGNTEPVSTTGPTQTAPASVTPADSGSTTAASPSETVKEGLLYQNDTYGFRFALPDSWQGYSIVMEEWQGYALEGTQSGKVTEKGPLLLIRHPLWTRDAPRQDIPIMIFTLGQWSQIEEESLSVGAAPIPPQELGRNQNYVFALPARYNFAFLTGFEEVASILEDKPLQPFDIG